MPTRQYDTSKWFNWQQPAVPLLLDLTFEACGAPFRNAFGIPCFTSVLHYREQTIDGETSLQASWLLRYAEGVAVGRLLTDMLSVPSLASSLETTFGDACDELLKYAGDMRGAESAEAALDAIDEFIPRFLRYYAVGATTEPVQWYCEEEITAFLQTDRGIEAVRASGLDAPEAKAALFAMSEESYSYVIAKSLLEMAIMDDAARDEGVQRHAQQYYWKANNYATVRELEPDDISAEVKAIAPDDAVARLHDLTTRRVATLDARSRILQHVPRDIRRLSMIADEFGSGMADHRKAVMLQALAGLGQCATVVAREVGLESADLSMFGPRELRRVIADPPKLQRQAEQRRSAHVLVLGPSPLSEEEMAAALSLRAADDPLAPRMLAPSVASGDAGERLLDEIDSTMTLFVHGQESLEVQGQVVDLPSQPAFVVMGTCRVVTDPFAAQGVFNEGEILVASSTTPDFVPLMHQASAVVTNMGGMLQHAAHFAREYGTPCIVGTGFATSVFRTGDYLALDLTTGRVKIFSTGTRE